ncbi:uncharacterized protein LOC8059519 isoform X2 [Sorghum bicolor]|nr:uncharacterized protein LOC8059519 isoform X2 [Sorghum bicolor]|eukprot:XP_021306106.1 uncharacterized protein LOC8059519 isoform X2 [Sorghum bicolor]
MEESSSSKPTTVKRLMEDELGKGKQLKIPNDEVQRILADLGHGACLDKSSTQNSKAKGDQNHSRSITTAAPSGSLDPASSNCMKEAEGDELEFALADFLGQIHREHDDQPHKNCKNNGELCTELKVLIQTKIAELDNNPCTLAYEQTRQGEEKDTADGKHLCSSSETQPKKFRDALEMLSSDTELFLKILQKPNSHILESVQRHQNRLIGTRQEPTKMADNTDSNKDTKSLNQHELATRTHGKESRHIFFWKKDRSNRRQTVEGTSSSQPVNKIVILKPNPRREIDHAVAVSSTQAPKLGATEGSKFSIKEVRRRFRIVTSEATKGRPSVSEDKLQKDQHCFKSSAFTIIKDTRQLAEQTSEGKSSSTVIKDFRSSNSGRQKKRNDGPTEINNSSIITTSKDKSVFYDEAKKHLTEILKDKTQTTKHPTLQISRSLVRMLSLPQSSTSSPRSSPRAKDCIYLSPEEASIHAIYKSKREEILKEESQSGEFSESVVCDPSEALHEQAVQERCFVKEESQETTQQGAELDSLCTEEIDKLDCMERNRNAWCTPAKQCTYKPSQDMVEEAEPGQGHVGTFPSSPENDFEKLECQEPTTPRTSAPIEQISQFSPDGNHEKQEQPSPVSVLDVFFHEDVDSTDTENMIQCEWHKDIFRTQYTTGDGSDQEIFWEDKDLRLGYIKELLELSELCTNQNLEVWYLEDELISPCLFEELHQGNQFDDTKLLFDCICEAVTEIQDIYFRSPPCLSSLTHSIRAPPAGQNLISEINKHVERHLHYQFPSTLDQLVNMDLEGGSWMDLRPESEEVTVVIWDCILDELLEEIVYDLWI